jgi:hypothetical protein
VHSRIERLRGWAWEHKYFSAFALSCTGFILYLIAPGPNQWHVALAIADHDCSNPAVCRYRPNLDEITLDKRGQPYHFVTNAEGFRGRNYPVERTPGTLRVQLYGDSFVFGLAADQGRTLPEILERELQQRLPGRRVEVMNMGFPATYLVTNLRTWEAYGRKYKPDIVVFAELRLMGGDFTARVTEIQTSPTLSWLMKSSFGRWLVNYYQTKVDRSARREVAEELLKLRDFQRETGVKVVLFGFFEKVPRQLSWLLNRFSEVEVLKSLMPPGLEFSVIPPEMDKEEYLKSPYAIPNEGHPSTPGHEHFAAVLADRIVPLVARTDVGR